jgi:hypothetical protein
MSATKTEPADLSPAQKVTKMAQIASEAIGKGLAAEQNLETFQKKVAAEIPRAVDALARGGFIAENEKQAMTRVFQEDPTRAFEVMVRMADRTVQEKTASAPNKPALGTSQGSAPSRTPGVPAHWDKFAQAIMG